MNAFQSIALQLPGFNAEPSAGRSLVRVTAAHTAVLIQFIVINMFSPKTAQPTSRPSDLLSLYRLPARLDAAQTAALLGFQPHNIAILIDASLLKPLGRPAPNGIKYFAAVAIERLRDDPEWLDKATRTISRRWQEKNRTVRTTRDSSPQAE